MISHSETLVVLGHGSTKHPDSSASVRRHAELLKHHGAYDEVRVAFLKEEPFIEQCLDGIETEKVIIIPDFLAEGYFTRQVIPNQLELSDKGKNIIYCPPVGTHPMMAELIDDAAKQVLGDWSVSETELFVIGHGSGKNPCSKQTLLHHLKQIRSSNAWSGVQDLWLEEPPQIGDWQKLSTQKRAVVVPYLLNDGQHGGWDIPADLGIRKGAIVHGVTHDLGDHQVRIAPALGTSARFADVINLLASSWSGR